MRELKEDTFLGTKNDDAHVHVERVLDILSLFNTPRVTHDAVMLCVFHITPTGAAKRWRTSSGSLNRNAAIASKLDRAHLDRDCPLNEEVKRVYEVKYGKFERSFPNNGGNRGRYRVGPLGYYTRVENRPPFGQRKPSLEELMNKHIEESTRRRNENEEWMKKLQETTDMNIRNQNAALKNLETQVEQLMKDFHAKSAKEAPNSSASIVSFISDDNVQVSKKKDEGPPGVLPCQLPPKELSPRSFTLPFTIVIKEYLVNISKRYAFWSLNEDILKITILATNTPYPSRKIRRIRAYTYQRPQRKQDQYVVSREDQYAVLEILYVNILEDNKRGPYSKKPQYAVSKTLDTPYRHRLQTL
ncbi:hypothetical protein Tco_0556846 [Tanacetum coccineum]